MGLEELNKGLNKGRKGLGYSPLNEYAANKLLANQYGLDSDINKLAREFNSLRADLDSPLVATLLKDFKTLGVSETDLSEINPEIAQEKTTKEKFLEDLQDTKIKALNVQMEVHAQELLDFKNKPKEKRMDFLKAIALVLTGALLTYFLQKDPQVTVINPMHPAKIQVVHDTIYLANKKTNRDTSLVRFVKLPHKSGKNPPSKNSY